jgi:hypothetical protein
VKTRPCNEESQGTGKTSTPEETSEHRISTSQSEKVNGSDISGHENSRTEVQQHLTKPLPQIYKGLLFIEELRNFQTTSFSDYFITYEGFWNECQETTESSKEMLFKYLKVFH